MDLPNTDFTLAGTLEEVKAKGRIILQAPIARSLSSMIAGASSPSTTVARTWASRSTGAASRMGS